MPKASMQVVKYLFNKDAKSMLKMAMPQIDFIDRKDNKKISLRHELYTLRKYVLGLEETKARDIIQVEFGMNYYKDVSNNIPKEKLVKTTVEGVSSISCNNETDKKEIKQSRTLTSGKLSITNETKYRIDIERLLKEPLKRKFKMDDQILIYHTHTNESYISDISKLNNMAIPQRSDNENINVIKVGKELEKGLINLNLKAMHNTTYHNVPSDRGAYKRSLETVKDCIKKNPNTHITLDIHRDGISNTKKLRMVENVDHKDVAKIMFVVGTNETGLSHDEWKENLKFALRLQQKLIGYNPNIVKPIFVSRNRYNQHLTNSSLIIEIGGDGNVISESIESTKYISRAIQEVFFENMDKQEGGQRGDYKETS